MKKLIVVSLFLLFHSMPAMAIDMPLKGVDGKDANISDYKGKWIVVNYWATWCPPCREEMPELQAFHDNHKDTDGVVIGLNTEMIGGDKILAFLDDYFVTYPNYMTGGPVSDTPLGRVPGLPTTFLVSPEGTVEARQVGGVTREMIEKFIKKWEAKQNKN